MSVSLISIPASRSLSQQDSDLAAFHPGPPEGMRDRLSADAVFDVLVQAAKAHRSDQEERLKEASKLCSRSSHPGGRTEGNGDVWQIERLLLAPGLLGCRSRIPVRRDARRLGHSGAGCSGRQMVQGRPFALLRRRVEGDAFGTIVYNGARQAEHDLGPTVDYIFSGWDPERMVQQLREAVAVRPDGIAMMGHAGDAAIMPLAEVASKAGVKMMYQNVPVPQVVAKYGGGYVGTQQAEQGRALAIEMVRRFALKKADVAIVVGGFDETRARPGNSASRPLWRRPASRSSALTTRPNGRRPQSRHSRHHGDNRGQPDGEGDRLPRRAGARRRRGLHAGGGQETGRDLQCRLRYEPPGRGRL